MTDLERLFYGIPLPSGVAAKIAAPLAGHPIVSGRAGPPANWHITLRFLGSTAPERKDSITRQVEQASLPPPFETRLGAWGAFPRAAAAKIFWISVADADGRFARLATALETTARENGFEPDERPFRPHITLARFRGPVDLRGTIAALPALELALAIDHFVLYRSTLGSGPPRYESLSVHRLPSQP